MIFNLCIIFVFFSCSETLNFHLLNSTLNFLEFSDNFYESLITEDLHSTKIVQFKDGRFFVPNAANTIMGTYFYEDGEIQFERLEPTKLQTSKSVNGEHFYLGKQKTIKGSPNNSYFLEFYEGYSDQNKDLKLLYNEELSWFSKLDVHFLETQNDNKRIILVTYEEYDEQYHKFKGKRFDIDDSGVTFVKDLEFPELPKRDQPLDFVVKVGKNGFFSIIHRNETININQFYFGVYQFNSTTNNIEFLEEESFLHEDNESEEITLSLISASMNDDYFAVFYGINYNAKGFFYKIKTKELKKQSFTGSEPSVSQIGDNFAIFYEKRASSAEIINGRIFKENGEINSKYPLMEYEQPEGHLIYSPEVFFKNMNNESELILFWKESDQRDSYIVGDIIQLKDCEKETIICPIGQYLDEYHENCLTCPEFRTTLSEGATSEGECICMKNYFKENFSDDYSPCIRCPDNSFTEYSGENSIGQCICEEGFLNFKISNIALKCIKGDCPKGSTKDEDEDQCKCSPGYYASTMTISCELCPEGTYKSQIMNLKECSSCGGSNFTSLKGSTSFNDCKNVTNSNSPNGTTIFVGIFSGIVGALLLGSLMCFMIFLVVFMIIIYRFKKKSK